LSEPKEPSWMTMPPRETRTFVERRNAPLRTMQPAMVPMRETFHVCLTSARPTLTSRSSGLSLPSSAARNSSISL
jgi:hypothetical protein